jgi:hypothetical protein
MAPLLFLRILLYHATRVRVLERLNLAPILAHLPICIP